MSSAGGAKRGGRASEKKAPARASGGRGALRTQDRGAGGDSPTMISIGYGNLVTTGRVIAVVSPQSNPMRRLREEAGQRGKLIDATEGRRTRSILVTDSDHVILSAINPETIASRIAPDELGEEGA